MRLLVLSQHYWPETFRITEVVAMGVALCEGKLRPLGETSTTGEWLERLPLAGRLRLF